MGGPQICILPVHAEHYSSVQYGSFSKIRGTILRVPIKMTIVCWGLHWGPPTFGETIISFFQGCCFCEWAYHYVYETLTQLSLVVTAT